MKSCLSLLILLLLSSPTVAIINGITANGSEPFAKSVVGIGRKSPKGGYHIFCTASLLNKNTILTAGHCLLTRDHVHRDGPLYVIFGLNEKDAGTEARLMMKKKVHKDRKTAYMNREIDRTDIALAEFQGEAPAEYAPVTLLRDESPLREGVKVTLAGYGFNDAMTPKGSGILRYTHAPIKSISYARTELVVDESRTGTCNIDSGGPSFLNVDGVLYQWGITSFGDPGCVGEGKYTKVPSYIGWIQYQLDHPEEWITL